eukprot:CAMPEP_0177664752 /NCGR_PEP_ID=MMETSP0447-20121125/20678_1 /TAXON_ID=0 /ORGANISM="Stygamoeba regulata, Strain BSH-02190019" /LENGTH=442 /DNA_ID=CAMNT_0019170779 /DNA_START=110 /DNA_END=1434 /DNA_ORIENTATION=+
MKTRHSTQTVTHCESPSPSSSPVRRVSPAISKASSHNASSSTTATNSIASSTANTTHTSLIHSRKRSSVAACSSSSRASLRVSKVDALAAKIELAQPVHYVLKNKEFYFELSAHGTESKPLCLYDTDLVASLHYDVADKAPVPTVRSTPLTYRLLPTTPSATTVRAELKCSALSTQHEGMLFIVRLALRDHATGAELCHCFSPALRVISKREQLTPRSQRIPRRQMKTATERIQENIYSVQQLQLEQQSLLQRLLAHPNLTAASAAAAAAAATSPNSKCPPIQPQDAAMCFAQRLRELLAAYEALPEAVRPQLVSRSLDELNPQQSLAVDSLLQSVVHRSLHPPQLGDPALSVSSAAASQIVSPMLATHLAPFCAPQPPPSTASQTDGEQQPPTHETDDQPSLDLRMRLARNRLLRHRASSATRTFATALLSASLLARNISR